MQFVTRCVIVAAISAASYGCGGSGAQPAGSGTQTSASTSGASGGSATSGAGATSGIGASQSGASTGTSVGSGVSVSPSSGAMSSASGAVGGSGGSVASGSGVGGAGSTSSTGSIASSGSRLPVSNCPASWTATPTCGGPTTATPDFGPNVLIFDPTMSMTSIQSQLTTIDTAQDGAQFGTGRYAF